MTIAGIFKAYDIRGIAEADINKNSLTDSDEHSSSSRRPQAKPSSSATTCAHHPRPLARRHQGISDEGADVVDAGLVSTPLFYFATKNYPAGVMVTASHNPKEYNGFKLCKNNLPISYATGIHRMEELITKSAPKTATVKGAVQKKRFSRRIPQLQPPIPQNKKEHTIVVDAANGMGGYTYTHSPTTRKEKQGKITIKPLFFELDGTFPNHEANPLKVETLHTSSNGARNPEPRSDLHSTATGTAASSSMKKEPSSRRPLHRAHQRRTSHDASRRHGPLRPPQQPDRPRNHSRRRGQTSHVPRRPRLHQSANARRRRPPRRRTRAATSIQAKRTTRRTRCTPSSKYST